MTRSQPPKGRSARRPIRDEAANFLAHDHAGALRRLARIATQRLDVALEPTGLTATQCHLLCLITTAQDDSMAAIAGLAGLDPSTLTRTLAPLAERGLVEIQTNLADRRRRAVWPTEKGLISLGQALDLARASQQDLTSGLPAQAPALLARWQRAWAEG